MTQPIINMKNIHYQYDKKDTLDHIHFRLEKGSFTGLVGPNGGGKTTFIKLVLGLLKPVSGIIELFGQPVQQFHEWNRIGFVSQQANAFNKGFPATVFEVVSMGLTAKIGYFRFFNKQHKRKVLQVIDQVGLREYTYENVGNLSGGQQQRVFIARALVNDPDLLILDEPTVGVDAENVKRFYAILQQLHQKRQITLLLVTHDTGLISKYATDIAFLNKQLHFHGSPEEYKSLSEQELLPFYGDPINNVTREHM